MKKLRQFALNFYALNKNGEHGSASLWSARDQPEEDRTRGRYAVNDGRENKLYDMVYLYE